MKRIALFNHKGGVGKTTLTVNIADALADMGKSVLVVDADPQCNLTSFFLSETDLERLLGESDEDESAATIWSAVRPVVKGRGTVVDIPSWDIGGRIRLLPGDVLLSDYEEELPTAWMECFARKSRGYDVETALSKVVSLVGKQVGADYCFYDVGPNVGALNRAVILDCDYFITPVASDLFSLRALTTVGRSIGKWIRDWQTVRSLASQEDRQSLPLGMPKYLGYITSAFKVSSGRNAANPHADWERRIAPRVRDRIVQDLRQVDASLVPDGPNKIGGIKHFHSLAAEAQKHGVAIGKLRGLVNPGHYAQVDEACDEFRQVAREIVRRSESA